MAVVYQAVARKMPSYLDDSEALKVDTKELEDHVLAPHEPRVDIDHVARQARGEQHQRWFQILKQSRSKREPDCQYGKMGGALENAHRCGAGMPGS